MSGPTTTSEKRCPRCSVTKPIATGFYGAKDRASKGGVGGWCKECERDRCRSKPQTQQRLVRNRARQRATQRLVLAHPDEFRRLYEEEQLSAAAEAAKLAATPEVTQLFPDGQAPRLRPGKAPVGEEPADRLGRVNETWCAECLEYHRNDHRHVSKVKLTAEEFVEDVETILASTTDVEVIAKRVGLQPASVVRQLQRYGRDDLVARISGGSHAHRRTLPA